MAARTLPGIGLTGFWDLGFDGWKDGMDANLRVLSALVQAKALDLVSAEPGSPTNGDIYLLDETHATQANDIAIRDNGAWVYVTPLEGAIVYDVAAGLHRSFDGTVWAEFSAGGGAGGTRIISAAITGSALTASEVLGAFTPPSGETWTFPANFTGASGLKLSGGTNPAGSYAIDVTKNGASVGTITISTGGVVSFATSGGTSFALTGGTDEMQLVGPASTDTALGYSFTIPFTY